MDRLVGQDALCAPLRAATRPDLSTFVPAADVVRFMRAALAFGRRGLGRTAPNPSVGALVVKDGKIEGRGCTADGGRPHAETTALAQAREAARGSTLFVTLEPCSHHGQTPPCCEAIVAAGVARLVYTIEDPHNLVAGQGAAFCRRHGIEVVSGVCADEARRDHRGHIRLKTVGRPAVSLKLAETANGFVAGGPHDPRLAITGAAANGAVHVMRAMHDAIMVGVGTVLADDPLMTVRLPGVTAAPLRIILDPGARTPPRSRLMQTARQAPVLVCIAGSAPRERVDALGEIPNVELWCAPADGGGRLDIAALLSELGRRGVTRVFSEGGPGIAASLVAGNLADDVLVFTAPRPLTGEGVPIFDAATRAALADPKRFRLVETAEIGADRLRHYESLA